MKNLIVPKNYTESSDSLEQQKVNILLVDDRPENLLALEAVLASANYNIVKTRTGEDALRCVLKEEFAVILMDVQMPVLNGFDTAKLIKQREKNRHIPIIFVTALSQAEENVQQGYEAGAIDYIFKPFHPETLRQKVDGFVRLYLNTKRIKLQSEQLNKSAREIRTILESISDAFFAVDENWCFTYINKEAERLLGFAANTLYGRSMWHKCNSIFTAVRQQLYNAMEHIFPLQMELKLDDSEKWYDLHAYPSAHGLSIYLRDITKRVHLEKEMTRLDRLNIIGEMAASIAHEVRNPMTTVCGFLQLAKEKKEVLSTEYIDLMVDELNRANMIIKEFLTMARNKKTDKRKKNINEVINALLPLIQADAMLADKYIDLDLAECPDLLLDEKEIRQLILNLVKNGLEEMTSGKRLSIRTYVKEQEVFLEVQDQGHGIPEEIVDKICTPFFTTKEGGTGLGLAVCTSIAKRHNAVLEMKTGSEGTVFITRFSANQD